MVDDRGGNPRFDIYDGIGSVRSAALKACDIVCPRREYRLAVGVHVCGSVVGAGDHSHDRTQSGISDSFDNAAAYAAYQSAQPGRQRSGDLARDGTYRRINYGIAQGRHVIVVGHRYAVLSITGIVEFGVLAHAGSVEYVRAQPDTQSLQQACRRAFAAVCDPFGRRSGYQNDISYILFGVARIDGDRHLGIDILVYLRTDLYFVYALSVRIERQVGQFERSVGQGILPNFVLGIRIVCQIVTRVILIIQRLLVIRGYAQSIVFRRLSQYDLIAESVCRVVYANRVFGSSVAVQVDFQPNFHVAADGSFHSVGYRQNYSVDLRSADLLFGEQTGFDGAGSVIADCLQIFSGKLFGHSKLDIVKTCLQCRAEAFDRVVSGGFALIVVSDDIRIFNASAGIDDPAVGVQRRAKFGVVNSVQRSRA